MCKAAAQHVSPKFVLLVELCWYIRVLVSIQIHKYMHTRPCKAEAAPCAGGSLLVYIYAWFGIYLCLIWYIFMLDLVYIYAWFGIHLCLIWYIFMLDLVYIYACTYTNAHTQTHTHTHMHMYVQSSSCTMCRCFSVGIYLCLIWYIFMLVSNACKYTNT